MVSLNQLEIVLACPVLLNDVANKLALVLTEGRSVPQRDQRVVTRAHRWGNRNDHDNFCVFIDETVLEHHGHLTATEGNVLRFVV